LVPREYFISTYFQAEQDAINGTEALIGEHEATLQELVESVEYEPEEDEEITAKLIKDYLKAEIKGLVQQGGAEDELTRLKAQLGAIAQSEVDIKEAKATLKELNAELDQKIEFKMYGVDDAKADLAKLLGQNRVVLASLEAEPEPIEKKLKNARAKRIKDLKDDNGLIETRLDGLDDFLKSIGGVITSEQCRELILQKHNDLVRLELGKYLNAEKREIVEGVVKLWDKYAIPANLLESQREESLRQLHALLADLDYVAQ